ncbi:MAG: hypothetical protein Q8S92_15670 [Hydrogenophaga sp.]|uniref:hypothetical protein n=1 Tax=Hydrogenophaga sp. TaxID=1904254 RepID=UPI0027323113|nr:hypothetical protein [Hydrogenophaga sp.]MDP3350428.1 hypothetical protein [Hydrogenophaga sp.]
MNSTSLAATSPGGSAALKLLLTARATHHGPNPFSRDPVVVVDLAVMASAGPAPDVARLEAGLAALSPWFGGAGDTLDGQTDAQRLALCLVHWSLGALNFVRGYLHAAGTQAPDADRSNGPVTLWLGFHDPAVSLAALRLGAQLMGEVAAGSASAARFEAALAPLWKICRQMHPDYQARIVMEAARVRNLPVSPAWGRPRHWQFGQGAKSRVLFESTSVDDGLLGAQVAASKAASKQMLRALGLPTPAYVLVTEAGALAAAAAQVGFPCATKPLDRGGGKGVSVGHQDLAGLQTGFEHARSVSAGPVMVEAFVAGDDHRLMVVDGRLRAVIRRDPAAVVGDGVSTLRELVLAANAPRDARSLLASRYLNPIVLDPPALQHLAHQHLTPDSVLSHGQRATLRSNANLSTGGSCTDVSAQVHPQLRTMAETLAQTLGVRMLGADYLCTDPALSPHAGGGAFIEFNLTPGLDVLLVAGWSAQAAGALALGDSVGRIAIDLLVVSDLELAWLEGTLVALDWPPGWGWATAHQACLMGMTLLAPGKAPWSGLRALLAHRSLNGALVLCSVSQLERHGLPLDHFDAVYLAGAAPSDDWMRVIWSLSDSQYEHADARSALLSLRRRRGDRGGATLGLG